MYVDQLNDNAPIYRQPKDGDRHDALDGLLITGDAAVGAPGSMIISSIRSLYRAPTRNWSTTPGRKKKGSRYVLSLKAPATAAGHGTRALPARKNGR
jgi:hypothetical protein